MRVSLRPHSRSLLALLLPALAFSPTLLPSTLAHAAPTAQASSRASTQVPTAQLERIAQRHLATFPGLEQARIVWYAPLFAPDAAPDAPPAYYEVKLESESGSPLGHLVLSTSPRDLPVAEFSTEGPTWLERFQARHAQSFRMVRYGVGFVAAEGLDGRFLSGLGERPLLAAPEWERLRTKASGLTRVEEGSLTVHEVRGVLNDAAARSLFQGMPATDAAWYRALQAEYPRFLPQDQARLERAWADVPRPDRPFYGPIPAYEVHAAKTLNHGYHVQLAPMEAPNDRHYYTGCGPTSWVNLWSYWDLNALPELYGQTQRYNNDLTNDVTLGLRDHLNTFPAGQSGCTLPWRMDTAPAWMANLGATSPSYVAAWGFVEPVSLYAQARPLLIDEGQPFIVGYYQDWHYALALAVAESKPRGWEEEAWIYIYPGWSSNETRFSSDDSYNKWIPVFPNVFGVWGLSSVTPSPVRDVPLVGDFNGDGLDDVAALTPTQGLDDGGEVRVALSEGSALQDASSWLLGFGSTGQTFRTGDVNGDGRSDLIAFTQGTSAQVLVALSAGNRFDAPMLWKDDFAPGGHTPEVGDVDGDGRADLVSFGQWSHGNVWLALAEDGRFGQTRLASARFSFDGAVPGLGDFDGDGRADLISFSHDSAGRVMVASSTGVDFGEGAVWQSRAAYADSLPLTGDFNGDGLQDLVDVHPESAPAQTSEMSEESTWTVEGAVSEGAYFGANLRRLEGLPSGSLELRTGDVDGDGRDDLITFLHDGSGDVLVSLSSGQRFETPATWAARLMR